MLIKELSLEDAIQERGYYRREQSPTYDRSYLVPSLGNESHAGDSCHFNLLVKVANIVLMTLHAKAGIKQVYPLANKNKPEGSERKRMYIDRTLSTILDVKIERPESICYNFNPSQKLIESAKKVTKTYNAEHRNKQSRSNTEVYFVIINIFVF